MKKRVVITGIGVISPIGNDKNQFFSSLESGKSGIDIITTFDTSEYRCKIGGEVKNIDLSQPLSSGKGHGLHLDRASKMALLSAGQAINDAALKHDYYAPERCMVVLGTTLGGMVSGQDYYKQLKHDSKSADPSLILDYLPNSAGDLISTEYGFTGGNICISTACSSGTHAIGYGFNMIRRGDADLVVSGGFDTMCKFTFAGFSILRVVDSTATKPFSKNRNGLNLGEGAAMLTLESLDNALARGATIYAEVVGYGASCDAYHMTAPATDGNGAARAMQKAMNSAGVTINDIDYINAHGTGTKFNDLFEAMAIHKVFGERSAKIPVSSTKSMTGHTLGAAGSIEAIAAVFSISKQFIHPTISHSDSDEKCGLDVVPNVGREAKVNTVMSNSFGFGGNNAVLIFKKLEKIAS